MCIQQFVSRFRRTGRARKLTHDGADDAGSDTTPHKSLCAEGPDDEKWPSQVEKSLLQTLKGGTRVEEFENA